MTTANMKGPYLSQILVCHFWATVLTWQCNMADSKEDDLLPL